MGLVHCASGTNPHNVAVRLVFRILNTYPVPGTLAYSRQWVLYKVLEGPCHTVLQRDRWSREQGYVLALEPQFGRP